MPTANPAVGGDRLIGALPGAGSVLTACFVGMFMITLDAVVVNVALPAVRADLGGGMTGLQWVVDGYTLAFAALLLSGGAIADRVGARPTFILGLAVFTAASAACTLSPDLTTLVMARVLQGAAAAVMTPSSMALLGQTFPDPRRRAKAVGVWAMGGAVASTSGPVLGGLLATVDWRLIFLVNVPVGAAALILLRRGPVSRGRKVPFDWIGQRHLQHLAPDRWSPRRRGVRRAVGPIRDLRRRTADQPADRRRARAGDRGDHRNRADRSRESIVNRAAAARQKEGSKP